MRQVRQGLGTEPGEAGPAPLARPGRPRGETRPCGSRGQRRDGHGGVDGQSSQAEEIFTLGEKGKGGTR